MILPKHVLINVIYYRPDAPHILQEFLWETPDVVPELPRVHRFLTYWRANIEATINQVLWAVRDVPEWRNLDAEKYIGRR
jgi:uncharacterized protein Usg